MTKPTKKTTAKKTRGGDFNAWVMPEAAACRRAIAEGRAASAWFTRDASGRVREVKRTPGVYVADLGTITVRFSKVDPLEQAKADFDAAQIQCIQAAIGISIAMPGSSAHKCAMFACERAGDEIVAAYAAVLRARDAAPIPLALTEKSMRELDERRDTKTFRKSLPAQRYKRGGSK